MKNPFTCKPFSRPLIWGMAALLGVACSQNREQPATAKAPTRMAPPRVTLIANLPDSSKPVVTYLKDYPAPKTIPITKSPQVHSFIDSLTNTPLPPESQGLGLFTNFTTDQGLAGDNIHCTVIDKWGNLWLGIGGGGVSCYDGKRFTSYTTKQGLANDHVWCMTTDKWGNLWIGTMGGGVSRYDGNQFTNYTTKQGLAGNQVYSILADNAGTLWFGTASGGVSHYNGKNFTNYTTAQGLADNRVIAIHQDKIGILWFGTHGGGVSRYDGKQFTNYTTKQGLAHNTVISILTDKRGTIWFGTYGGGISRFDGKTFINYTTAQGLAHNTVMHISEDKAGTIWVTTYGGGVSRFDGKRFTNFTTKQGLATDFVFRTLEDNQGNHWFGTAGGGVSRYDGISCINFTTKQGLAANQVTGVYQDKTGSLWFATGGGGVSRFDGKQFTNFTTKQGLADDNIYAIAEDNERYVWFGSAGNGGVSRYDGKQFTIYTEKQGLADDNVWCILVAKGGDIWFGTDSGGAIRFDGKSFTQYTTKQGLADDVVYSIIQDKRGDIWFATGGGGGVSRFDGKQFTVYTTDQGLPSNTVFRTLADKWGNLWFATANGLSRFDGKTFANYTTKEGLPGDAVYSVIADSLSNIVIGTNRGVGILTGFTPKSATEKTRNTISPQNSLSNDALASYSPEIEIYNTATGYPIKDVNTMFSDNKGITWIGTSSDKTGLVRFDYSAVHRNKNPPVVKLQGIKINNEAIGWQSLQTASTLNKAKLDSNTTAPHITEEVTTFGKVLSETERDSLRRMFSGVALDSVAPWYPIPVNLVLPHRHNSVAFAFNAIETSRNFMVKYQYKLDGYDADWSSIKSEASATFGNLYEGTYTLNVKARSPEGIWSQPLTYTFTILPPFWRTWWAYLLYALVFLGSLRAYIVFRSRALRRENRVLEEKVSLRTNQLQKKSSELETSLTNLKTTQTQLVQKEKMASLGELTAGIAHEIQNPLNFVNNFSELSSELVEELEEEHQKPARDSDLEIELMTDLKDNLTKILHHGNRASNIVKGMLEHARSSTGEVLPTDLNKLTEEYFRLAYQGLRAKDKGFNCALETHFDASIGQVSVIPQEIGRVLLNLFNNAFYAVHQRHKTTTDADYQPTVTVSTRLLNADSANSPERATSLARPNGLGETGGNGGIEIRVHDNGTGMSEAVKAKIFQPFFTTKPTGQGTGLGLSLSYDIITKGHGGELLVESVEGDGTTFVIRLPA